MNICILGSTGSIGTQTLDVIREYPEFRVVAMSAMKNIDLAEKQIREFKPLYMCIVDEKKAAELKIRVADTDTSIISGKDGMCEIASLNEVDIVVTATVGISGLLPTICAIKAGKNIALSNKETLVTGGHIVTKLAKENNVKILPVDSEHSAIFQSLQGNERKSVKKIILTASGGPFFGKVREELKNIKPEDALKHPNWNMGAKVTIDSATLVNKGLEVIEAKWLFDVSPNDIEVVVHRESVIHSMVEYCDNAVIAQLGVPDMKIPIQYALTYPKRFPMHGNELSFKKYSKLTFFEPDTKTFKALDIAYYVAREGGILPTVFNSADEAAVELFLSGKIRFLDIGDVIEKVVQKIKNIDEPTVEQILEYDKIARCEVQEYSNNLK